MKLVLATGNAGKIAEMRSRLAELGIEVVASAELGAPPVHEDGRTFEENARKKATAACRFSREWALAEDSGLEVDALDGAPGVFSARFAGEGASDEQNNQKLLAALADTAMERRTARFRAVMVLAAPDGRTFATEGICEGRIALEPRGESGFGYDPLFVPDGETKSFAEMTLDEKDAMSHRGRALRRMIAVLKETLASGAP